MGGCVRAFAHVCTRACATRVCMLGDGPRGLQIGDTLSPRVPHLSPGLKTRLSRFISKTATCLRVNHFILLRQKDLADRRERSPRGSATICSLVTSAVSGGGIGTCEGQQEAGTPERALRHGRSVVSPWALRGLSPLLVTNPAVLHACLCKLDVDACRWHGADARKRNPAKCARV